MKTVLRILVVSLFIFIFVKGVLAQPVEGKKLEFSTSASMWNIKYEWDDEATTIFNVPLRVGFYAYKGIEVEPELLLTIPEDGDTGILFLANVAFNLKASDKTIFFVLGGYGFGNSTPLFGFAWFQDENINALNFGGGIKHLISNSAAVRLEYRYIRYTDEAGDHFRTDNNLYLGISIFF